MLSAFFLYLFLTMKDQLFEADYSDDDGKPIVLPQNGTASFKANGCKA